MVTRRSWSHIKPPQKVTHKCLVKGILIHKTHAARGSLQQRAAPQCYNHQGDMTTTSIICLPHVQAGFNHSMLQGRETKHKCTSNRCSMLQTKGRQHGTINALQKHLAHARAAWYFMLKCELALLIGQGPLALVACVACTMRSAVSKT